MPDGWRYWAQRERGVEASGAGLWPSDEEALLEDGGRTLALVRVIGRRATDDPSKLSAGAEPHVWEPAFMAVAAELRSRRDRGVE